MALGSHTLALVLQTVSLAFLILAIITAPVVTSLYLSDDGDYKYGVLGYCTSDGSSCSSASAHYDPSSLTKVDDWKMNSSARNILSSIFIVAPIAGGLTLFALLFSIFAHFETLSSSRVYSGVGFFFSIASFLSTCLICIVTILCFYPHLGFVSWLLIPASVLTLISVVLLGFSLTSNKSSSSSYDKENESDSVYSSSNNQFNKYDSNNNNLNSFNNNTNANNNMNPFTANAAASTSSFGVLNKPMPTYPMSSTANSFTNNTLNTKNDNNNSLKKSNDPLFDKSNVFTGGFVTAPQEPAIDNNNDDTEDLIDQPQEPQQSQYDATNMYRPAYSISSSQQHQQQQPMKSTFVNGSYSDLQRRQDNAMATNESVDKLNNDLNNDRDSLDDLSYNSNDLKVPNIANPYEAQDEPSPIDDYDYDYDDDDDDDDEDDYEPEFKGNLKNKVVGDSNTLLVEGNRHNNHSPSDGQASLQSDFTSISQREINPKYYRGAPQKSTLPGQYAVGGGPQQQQQQPYMNYVPGPVSGPAPMQGPGYGAPPMDPGNYPNSQSYYTNNVQPNQMSRPYFPSNGYNQQMPMGPPQQRVPSGGNQTGRADVLLNSNPEFSIGTGPRRPGGGATLGTKPGARKYGLHALTHQQVLQQSGGVPQYNNYGGYKNKPMRNNMPPPGAIDRNGNYGMF